MDPRILVNCPATLFFIIIIIVQDCDGVWKLKEENVANFDSLFEKQSTSIGAPRAGIEDDTIDCYCEGFINGPYHAKASCMDQLYCEPKSRVKCSKSGGCLKNTYSVQGQGFVVKFCADSSEGDGEGCKIRRANSTVFGAVELNECVCKEQFCNGQLSWVTLANYRILVGLVLLTFWFY